MRADNSRHLVAAARQTITAHPPRAARRVAPPRRRRQPVTFDAARPRSGRLPVLALLPARPAPRDRTATRTDNSPRAGPASPTVSGPARHPCDGDSISPPTASATRSRQPATTPSPRRGARDHRAATRRRDKVLPRSSDRAEPPRYEHRPQRKRAAHSNDHLPGSR